MNDSQVDRLLLGHLFIALLCLKITGAIALSWWWIVAPLIVTPIAVFIVLFIHNMRNR